jgi:organic radical activating enzyme
MEKILIYGAGCNGELALDLLKNNYQTEETEICGFIDKNKSGSYLGYSIFKLDEIEYFNGKIVIAIKNYNVVRTVCDDLKKNGYTNIFWFRNQKSVLNYKDFFVEQCIDCSEWGETILRHVEMHISDACNLNCRGCAHYSPTFEKELPDIESRLNDVRRLNEKVSHIMQFYILGGEPLLNPQVDEYVREIRKILPTTELYIVTNGLLINKLESETLQTIRENNVWVSISEYPATHDLIGQMKVKLDESHILHEIRPYKQKFNIPLSLNENSRYPQFCLGNNCVTIWNGKVSRCPRVMYIPHFNSYFGTNLPEEGTLDLADDISGQELVDFLCKEVPHCKHCVKNEVDWKACGKDPKLEDFAVLD